jgi:hypothetical protein
MKNIAQICLTIFCLAIFCPKALAQTPIGIKQNTFTTNKDPSFAITGAANGVLQQQQGQGQQYYVVSGAGESLANGNYYLQSTNPLVYTNQYYEIQETVPFENVIPAGSYYSVRQFYLGQFLQVNTTYTITFGTNDDCLLGYGLCAPGTFQFVTGGDASVLPSVELQPVTSFSLVTAIVYTTSRSYAIRGRETTRVEIYVSTNMINWQTLHVAAPPAPTVTLANSGAASYITESLLQNAGGLTISNFSQYADTNGEASNVFQTLPPPSNTNLATQTQLLLSSNGVASQTTSLVASASSFVGGTITNGLASTQYVITATNGMVKAAVTNGLATGVAMTNIVNNSYSNNPSKYITSSAVSNMTALGSGVITLITNGGGLLVSSNLSAGGYSYSVGLDPAATNITYTTNLYAITLAQWGAFTTNANTWATYLAAINDYTNAKAFTNGLILSSVAASTYNLLGNYLTTTSNLNYSKFTNAPVIPATNGFVTSSITNGLATIAYVNTATNGFATQSITNGLATTNYVNTATNGAVTSAITNGLATIAFVTNQNYLQSSNVAAYYATTSSVISAIAPYATITTLNASSNYLTLANTTNVNTIALHWGTNQALVGSVTVNSNMTASFATNGGVITVTLGSTTNLYASSTAGLQPKSGNLTNWSTISTNQILFTPNLVTTLVAGNNVAITYTTNSSGVHATVNAYYQYNSPVQAVSGYIGGVIGSPYGFVSLTTGNSSYSSPSWSALPATPNDCKIYNSSSGAIIYSSSNGVVLLNSTVLTNITFTATGCWATTIYITNNVISQNVNIIAICH